jgi:hypothetical protein
MRISLAAGFSAITLAYFSSAEAQERDQYKDVLVNKVMDTTEFHENTYFAYSYISNYKHARDKTRQSDTSASGGYAGFWASLSNSDKNSISERLSQNIDLSYYVPKRDERITTIWST